MTNKLVDDVYETFPVILETLCHHNIIIIKYNNIL